MVRGARTAFAFCIAFMLCGQANADESAPSSCAKAVPVARAGKRIQDELALMGLTISATQVAQQHHFKDADVVYPEPVGCNAGSVTIKGETYTLWHNIAADTETASGSFDRITIGNASPQSGIGHVTLIADRHAASMRDEGDPPTPPVVYHVILESEDEITLLGTYDGPLAAEGLASLATGGYVGINARIDKKAHKVTIYRPT